MRPKVDRKWSFLTMSIALALSGVAMPTSGSRTKVRTPPRRSSSLPVDLKSIYSESHALLIGINRYPHLPKRKQLHYADFDAEELRDELILHYGFPPDHIHLLLTEKASKAAIEKELSGLANKKRVGKNDRILIFFSGHGQTVELPNKGAMGFLIPSDAEVDLADPTNAGPYLDTCIRMDSIWGLLQASPAKHALLLADACFGGLLVKQPRSLEKITPKVLAALSERRSRQAMSGGDSGQETEERPGLAHGVFTSKLLDELRARATTPDDVFTASELHNSVQRLVENFTESKQIPQFGDDDTAGDFLFITTRPQPVESKINGKDNAEMIKIPRGDFTMGSDEGDSDEKPVHHVNLDEYWIYKTPVTVAQYQKYSTATRKGMPEAPDWEWEGHGDHPIVNVSWDDADAYCREQGTRLPTEAEWEKAARGTDRHKFPWGNTFNASLLQTTKKALSNTLTALPVGSLHDMASPYGVLDMSGNVFQWVADWYDQDYYKKNLQVPNPVGPDTGTLHVLRGGPWTNHSPENFRVAKRNSYPTANSMNTIGFRCVSAPPAPRGRQRLIPQGG